MDASDLTRLLTATHYAPADLEQVNDLCRNYPGFSLAHMLKVRILEALGKDKETDLKRAAVYAPDRNRLYQLVTEVTPVPEEEEAYVHEEPEGIRFTDETNEEADLIIGQHAPYAGPPEEGTLLELDEEEGEEEGGPDPGDSSAETEMEKEADRTEAEAEIDEEAETDPESDEDEISSETLIEAVVKDETDLEDPEVVDDAPAIDVVEPAEEDETEEDGPADSSDGKIQDEDSEENDEEPEGSQEPEQPPEPDDPRLQKKRLIQNFIREDPGPIRADNGSSLSGDVSVSSIREHDGFITDTLAKIYVKQGLYAKAIYAYEKLSLKYPEKSAYFAAQIEKIRNINHS